MLKLI
jgi:hypothetical protein